MALHAIEDLDDAYEATRAFLTPFDRTRWLKLALVVLFVGGPGANLNVFQYTGGGNGDGLPPGGVPMIDPGSGALLIVAAAVVAVLLFALLLAFVGSVMEFVFVESLRNQSVTLRRYWSERWRQGVQLFAFRLVLGLFVFGGVVLTAGVAFLSFDVLASAVLGLILFVLLPLFLLLGAVVGVVAGFTNVFVVPIMVLEDRGVLAGWRRLWPTITAHWRQYLAYLVASYVLALVGSIAVGVVTLLLTVLLLIPFGLLFGAGFALAFVVEPVGIAVMALVGVLFGLSVTAVAVLLQVPVQTYLRYYALLVLGDVEPELDLIPDQRAAVRADEPDGE